MKLRGPLSVLSYIWHHPSNRGRRGRALLRALAWQIYKRTVGGCWDVRLSDNRIIRCYPNNSCASSVVYAGLYDFDVMHFLLRYLRATDHFLDLGANVGVYTILASTVVVEGTLHAFEPSAAARARLEENVYMNGLTNVRIHNVAAAEGAGLLYLTCDGDSRNYIVVGDRDNRVEQVVADALEDVVGSVRFAVAKMDVEGYELPALRGAVRMLGSHNPPVWLLELGHLSARYGYCPEDLVRFLRQYGYIPARYREDGNSLRWDPEWWMHEQNVLFIAESAFGSVESRLRESLAHEAVLNGATG